MSKDTPPVVEPHASQSQHLLREALAFNQAARKFAAELNRGKVGAPGVISGLDRDAYLKSIALKPKNLQ